jgi:hypothetical protein
MRTTLRLFILTVFAVALATKAHAETIDLESFINGDLLGNQIPGVTFANAQILTAGISLNEIDYPPHSGTNVAVDTGGAIRIDFSSPLVAFGAYFTYLVPIALEAFDAAGNSLGIVSSAFNSNLEFLGGTPNEFIEAAIGGIASVVITGDPLGGSFVMDDLVLTRAEVPEPGTLAMALLGIVAVRSTRTLRRSRAERC